MNAGPRRLIAAIGVIAATCALAAGTIAVAGDLRVGRLAAVSPTPSPVNPWLEWAIDLGFDGAGNESPSSGSGEVSDAVDRLSLAELESFNASLDAGSESTMRLASWLWSGVNADQVKRLHDAMPRLEPRIDSGLTWARLDVDLSAPPDLHDIHQGLADDCWLLAGLGAVALTDPGILIDRLWQNDNGTFTVTWMQDGTELPVTISPYLPVHSGGELVYAHGAQRGQPNWSSIYEKSHAALPNFGSFARLAGGSMIAEAPTTVAAAIGALVGAPSQTQPARTVTLAQLAESLDQGRALTATTFLAGLAPTPGVDDVPLVDRHVYVIVSIDGDLITLHNPWGYSTAGVPEVVQVPIDAFNRRVLLVTFGAR